MDTQTIRLLQEEIQKHRARKETIVREKEALRREEQSLDSTIESLEGVCGKISGHARGTSELRGALTGIRAENVVPRLKKRGRPSRNADLRREAMIDILRDDGPMHPKQLHHEVVERIGEIAAGKRFQIQDMLRRDSGNFRAVGDGRWAWAHGQNGRAKEGP